MNSQHRLLRLVCVCLAALFASQVSAAQKKLSVEETLNAQMDLLIKECKPTDEQQKTLKEKFKAKQDALEAWDKANAEKMSAAQTAATAARKGADADAKKKANGDLKALQTEREQSAAEADKAILAVLTDDQKSQWAGAQLAQTTLAKYKKNNLTDAQIASVKSASIVAAKELSSIAGDDRKDKAARTTVEKCLKWAIDNVILTPDQRGEAPKAASAPAAAPATPAPPAATTPAPVPSASVKPPELTKPTEPSK